jgi:hypothetical protein
MKDACWMGADIADKKFCLLKEEVIKVLFERALIASRVH